MSLIRILFLQSQDFFGADSEIQAQLMRYYDRKDCEVHAACTQIEGSQATNSSLTHLRDIPDLHLLLVNFGLSLQQSRATSRWAKAKELAVIPITLSRLARYIRKNRIQIIHGTEKPRDAVYGVLLGKLTGAKSVVHLHIGYGDYFSRPVKWALRHADAVVGVSKHTAGTVIAGGVPPAKVHSVLNALALESARWNTIHDGSKIRAEFGLTEATPVIAIVARIFRWKGHSDLIEALALVRDEFPSVRLFVVGEEDPRTHGSGKTYSEELRDQVRSLALESNVIFTGFRADIPDLMAACDVYAMPSWEEPFGMVYVEAMSQRKPVIAYNSGGASEVIKDEQTGLLTPPADIPALAEAIKRLLRDPQMRAAFGEAGRADVEREFRSDRMCRDMIAVYSTLLPERGAARQ